MRNFNNKLIGKFNFNIMILCSFDPILIQFSRIQNFYR